MKTPEEFLKALWGKKPPGVVLIWTLPAKKSQWKTSFGGINRDMEQHQAEDVYTGVGIASRNGGRFTTQNKLTEEEVGGLAGMWADIDWDDPVHRKPHLPPSLEQALETMEEALLEPTLLINSGHGLQGWWLFKEPWMFLNAEDHELGRRAAQWWHQHIKGLFTARGWAVDSVFNLDRIMRLPGTWNNRNPDERKPVTVIEDTGRRYTPQEFLDLVPEDFRTSAPPPGRNGRGPRRKGTSTWTGTAGASGLELRPDAEPSAMKLAALLKASPKFRRSWEQDRADMTDQSASAYDMSMATIAMQAGWNDQEVVDLLICWRNKHGHDLKLRENYYAHTISKAREPMQMDQAQEQLDEALSQPSEDQPEVLKDNLATLFGVDILRFVKYLGDPSSYFMYTKQGDITLGPITNIISQEKFRAHVGDATGIMILRVPRRIWEQRVQAILKACEEVEVGDASHPAQETHAWLEEYLLEKPPRVGDEWEKAAEAKRPFVLDGTTHIFLDDFRRWLEAALGAKLTTFVLGQRLRQAEAYSEATKIRVGRNRTTRTTWVLPERHLPQPPDPPDDPEGG